MLNSSFHRTLCDKTALPGGISTFRAPKPENNWRRIKAGTVGLPDLVVTIVHTKPKTRVNHYTIRPATDQFLTDYINQTQKFLIVERLPLQQAIEYTARGINS